MLHYHWEHCRECDGIQLIDQRGKRAPGDPSNVGSSDRNELCSCPSEERSDGPEARRADDLPLEDGVRRR